MLISSTITNDNNKIWTQFTNCFREFCIDVFFCVMTVFFLSIAYLASVFYLLHCCWSKGGLGLSISVLKPFFSHRHCWRPVGDCHDNGWDFSHFSQTARLQEMTVYHSYSVHPSVLGCLSLFPNVFQSF